jgi:tRNA-dihydrouridine synthase B
MHIGNIKIDNPFVQAPMAGWTDAPFRTIARRFHKGLLFTEMVSAEALCRGNKRTLQYCRIDDEHHPVALQLVGHDADRMAEAARLAEGLGPDIIDINAGCPDLKIIMQGAGGGLLRKPAKLVTMVEKVVRTVNVPVSVKLRLGWNSDESVRIGKMLVGTGAAFLTFNCYLVTQNYSGPGDRGALRKIVQDVGLPVIANGGVRDEEDAVGMLESTGAAGVMMGRATRGRPDRPETALEMLKEGKFRAMDRETVGKTVMEHARLECEQFGEERGMSRMRKHIHWYMKAAGTDNRSLPVDRLSTLEELGKLLDSGWQPIR